MSKTAKTLGKYQIMEEIGRGAHATVYKARDTTLDRVVALKVMRPGLLWDPDAVERKIGRALRSRKVTSLPIPDTSAFGLLSEISRRMPPRDKSKLDVTRLYIRPGKVDMTATAKDAKLAIPLVSPSWGGQTSIDKLRKVRGENNALLDQALKEKPNDIELNLLDARRLSRRGTTESLAAAHDILDRITVDNRHNVAAWLLLLLWNYRTSEDQEYM